MYCNRRWKSIHLRRPGRLRASTPGLNLPGLKAAHNLPGRYPVEDWWGLACLPSRLEAKAAPTASAAAFKPWAMGPALSPALSVAEGEVEGANGGIQL